MNAKILGDRIRALMEIKHVKRNDLAKELGVSYNTVTQKLMGRREFGLSDMLIIKRVLGLDNQTCAELFFDDDFRIPSKKEES